MSRKTMLLVFAALACVMMLGTSGVAAASTRYVGTQGADLTVGTRFGDALYGLGSGDLMGGDPTQFGTGGDDAMYGGGGNDAVYGRSGDDLVHGGAGNDELGGTKGADATYGDDGNDFLIDGPLSDHWGDLLWGGDGDDELDAYNDPAFADEVVCGPGQDVAYVDKSDVVATGCEAAVAGPAPNNIWKQSPFNRFD